VLSLWGGRYADHFPVLGGVQVVSGARGGVADKTTRRRVHL